MSKKNPLFPEVIFTLLYELYGDKSIRPVKTYVKGTKASLVEAQITINGVLIFLRILRQKEFQHFDLTCSSTNDARTAVDYLKITSLVPPKTPRELVNWQFGSDAVSKMLSGVIQKTKTRNINLISAYSGDVVIPLLKSVPIKKTFTDSYLSA